MEKSLKTQHPPRLPELQTETRVAVGFVLLHFAEAIKQFVLELARGHSPAFVSCRQTFHQSASFFSVQLLRAYWTYCTQLHSTVPYACASTTDQYEQSHPWFVHKNKQPAAFSSANCDSEIKWKQINERHAIQKYVKIYKDVVIV